MTRSRLLNKFRQERTISSHVAHKEQWNICVKLLPKTKKDNLDVKRVTNNKQFGKTVKPYLTDKTLKDEIITLIENEKVVSDDKRELVNIFNEYFSNTVSNVDIQRPPNTTLHHEPMLNAKKKKKKRKRKPPKYCKELK